MAYKVPPHARGIDALERPINEFNKKRFPRTRGDRPPPADGFVRAGDPGSPARAGIDLWNPAKQVVAHAVPPHARG